MTVRSKPGTALAAVSAILLSITVLLSLAAPLTTAKAQQQISAEQLANLQPVDPSQIPPHATFWEWFYGNGSTQPIPAPVPRNPYGPDVPVYYIDGHYFICNGPDDLNLFQQQRQLQAQMGQLQPMADSGSIAQPNDATPLNVGFAPGTFYICSITVSNQVISLVLTNTVQGTNYEILSWNSLLDPAGWISEGVVPGLDGATPVSIWMGNRTNQLFLQARSLASADDSSIPDSWWQQLGLPNTTDPYTFEWSGDGYTFFDAYRNNWSPGDWHTPATPRGLAVRLDSGGATVTVSWLPSDGVVTGYTLERWDPTTGTTQFALATNQTSYSDSFVAGRKYWLQALYGSQGPSAWSACVSLSARMPNAVVVRGPQGRDYLALSPIPSSAVKVHLTADWYYGNTNFDMSVTCFTNGIAQLPDMTFVWAQYPGMSGVNWTVQTVDTNGILSDFPYILRAPIIPYFDGRTQLKDNLAFLIRDTRLQPFSFGGAGDFIAPPDYAYSAFCGEPESLYGYGYDFNPNEFRPFGENYFYRNLIFSTDDVDPSTGWLTTVTSYSPWGPGLNPPLKYTFSQPTNLLWSPPPSMLSQGQDQWTINGETGWGSGDLYDLYYYFGIYDNGQGRYAMDAGGSNYFGLALTSAAFAYNTNGTLYASKLMPGGTVPDVPGCFYGACDQPNFLTTGYYFARLGVDPLPGDIFAYWAPSAFSPTNTTQLLIASVGQQGLTLAGYAQQIILNGNQTLPAYLGQYFGKAYLANTNNEATTNETGLLSEYGEYLPTQTGLNILTTKPDLTQTNNLQGQCPIHVIALATDVNHDGVIDTSYGGQDFTSYYQPFRFWVNDTYDVGDDFGSGIPGTWDNGFLDGCASEKLHSTRALVNFFPVQVCIQSLLKAVPSLSTLTFKLSNAGSTLYYLETDLTPDNYRDYLTSTNFLSSLPIYRGSAGHIDQGYPATLTTNFLAKIRDAGKGILLMEASGPTTMPLDLEVWQGTNLLATTSLYLSIQPVEQMFRHKNLIRETFPSATSAGAPPDRLTDADVPNEPETSDKNFVFVHGYNVLPDEARGTFADMFKRMYWAGSHARFYGVTWLGASTKGTFPFYNKLTPNYHTNVVNAFKTAPHLADFIATLTNSGPVTLAAHSLGNMVTLSAISDCNAPISQYFMLDAAVPIEAIDPAATTNMMVYSTWVNYANRLYASDWYQLFATDDARSTLSWNNRLGNLRNVDVYNFYSSGEEVLRTTTLDPPSSVLNKVFTQVCNFWEGYPFGSFTWYWQEKGKGTCSQDWFLGSSHGGWKFNVAYDNATNLDHMLPADAAQLSTNQLQFMPFFDKSVDGDLFILDIGNTYAQANRNRILSDAIPAMSLVAGANPIPKLAPFGQPNKNLDMMTFKNGWPQGRTGTEVGMWHHSDYHEVAYTFTHSLFDQFIAIGNLK